MNVVTISILSLFLALSSSGSTDAAKKSDSQTVETSKETASGSLWGSLLGVNLNHNETLLRDAASKPTGTCMPMECGANHNERLHDAAANQQREWNSWVRGEQPCDPFTLVEEAVLGDLRFVFDVV